MSKEEIAAQVREIFRETLSVQPDKLQADTNLKHDLALDSLDMIEVVYEMEDRFDVQIPEAKIQEIATFDQIVDGLYEAIDYTPVRQRRGESSAVVRSFMAHHQGMTLLSLAYLILDQPMQKRFESDPLFKATLMLLQERIPKAMASSC